MAEIQNEFLISAVIRKARRDRARDDILYFAEYYLSHILENQTPLFHKEIFRLLFSENRLGIAAPRGFAKAQSLESNVLTPDRWKKIKEIKIGDLVIGKDGTPKKVFGLTPITKMDLYRITTRDGRSTLCNLEHLWNIQCPQNTKNQNWKVRPLKQIIGNYKRERVDKRTGKYYIEYKYYLDWADPINFEEKKLPIDPYTFGVWLGYGANVVGGFTTGGIEILEFFPYSIKKIRPLLRTLGVLSNKHIPDIYLFSSVKQREALLQGLIDTNGSVVKGGGIVEFCNTNRKLIDDVCYLIRSLGGTATIGDGISMCNNKEFHYYKITARFPKEIIPVRLSRKRKLWRNSLKTKSAIIDIRYEKNDLGRCLNVEGGFYITDDFLLTHNSSLVLLIYGLHSLLFNKGEDILIISKSASLAEDWLRKIKSELENNERIRQDFGSLLQWGEKDSKRWTASHIVLQQENLIFSQMKAKGRGCQVRGLRPTKVLADDLEDEEEVRSEEQRKFNKEWFLGALLNVLKTDQQLVVIGTVLHPLSLLADLIDKKEQFQNWTTKKYKALENGKSLWNDRFPVEDLLKRKSEIGIYAFEAEYQNNPISSDTCLWKPDWIKKFDKLPKIEKVFAALDPATSTKESSDFSAIVVMGIGKDNNIYELFSTRGHWGTWELIDKIIDTQKRFNPIRFGIEEGALTNIIRPVLIKKTELDKTLRVPLEAISLGRYTGQEKKIKQATDKYSRALSVIHYWEQGTIYLKNQDLIDEIATFPTGRYDDFVDACVYCVKLIMKYSPLMVMFRKQDYRQGEKSFTIVDDRMPCLAPPISETFRKTNSWRINA